MHSKKIGKSEDKSPLHRGTTKCFTTNNNLIIFGNHNDILQHESNDKSLQNISASTNSPQ